MSFERNFCCALWVGACGFLTGLSYLIGWGIGQHRDANNFNNHREITNYEDEYGKYSAIGGAAIIPFITGLCLVAEYASIRTQRRHSHNNGHEPLANHPDLFAHYQAHEVVVPINIQSQSSPKHPPNKLVYLKSRRKKIDELKLTANTPGILADFIGPISHEIMIEPVDVECPGRHTFERSKIEKWLAADDNYNNNNNSCPCCKQQLSSKRLTPNQTLYRTIGRVLDALEREHKKAVTQTESLLKNNNVESYHSFA